MIVDDASAIVLEDYYGRLFLVRAPAPVNLNKAGANYKSEVPHLEYSPRQAFREWLDICDAIVALGADAVLMFEDDTDAPFLDKGDLQVRADGTICTATANTEVGRMTDILTGRVFTANGPWVRISGGNMNALLPNMLAHRAGELDYFKRLLGAMAAQCGLTLNFDKNPYRWEGLADIAVLHDVVVFTYTTQEHYAVGLQHKTLRSSRHGAEYAARFAGIETAKCLFFELSYPHFHGDTVHFVRRGRAGKSLVSYPQGLWSGDQARYVQCFADMQKIDSKDAVQGYAANSRQVTESGILVPSGVSETFVQGLHPLDVQIVVLDELFGKAGGGPGCATLQLPSNLVLPDDSELRYSNQREAAKKRTERLAESVRVDISYFQNRKRG